MLAGLKQEEKMWNFAAHHLSLDKGEAKVKAHVAFPFIRRKPPQAGSINVSASSHLSFVSGCSCHADVRVASARGEFFSN
jgi:hypothetical protein